MSRFPWGLNYWNTGEWQVCQERLRDMDKLKIQWNPGRDLMFKALQKVKLDDVRVLVLGQDPYPKRKFCTGLAFSIPDNEDQYPPSLSIMFDEYVKDLQLPYPTTGCLDKWAEQGVLLWNVLPSCTSGKPMSHNWHEYYYLTWEILDKLYHRPVVVATCGGLARSMLREADYEQFPVLSVAHPSPRANYSAKRPFMGSRFFTTVNVMLAERGCPMIDWRLPDDESGTYTQTKAVEEKKKAKGKRILEAATEEVSDPETLLREGFGRN